MAERRSDRFPHAGPAGVPQRSAVRRACIRNARIGGTGIRRARIGGTGIGRACIGGTGIRRAGIGGTGIRRAGIGGTDIRRACIGGTGIRRAGIVSAGIGEARIDPGVHRGPPVGRPPRSVDVGLTGARPAEQEQHRHRPRRPHARSSTGASR